MSRFHTLFQKISKSHWQIAAVVLLVLLATILLWFYNSTSIQAEPALLAQVYFDGEYRIGDGAWQAIEPNKHIPSTAGDVTLRGNFHLRAPDGEYVGVYRGDIPVAFYINHVSVTFFEAGFEPYTLDMENPLFGNSACGVNWTAHSFLSDSEETIEILIHNPHRFGNENAIDEILGTMSLWANIDFEKTALDAGATERSIGLVFVIVSLALLGIALFSTLIHIKNTGIIWVLGTMILFAGIYFAYGADGVSFWSDSIVFNTTILGTSMMFYMLFLSMIVVCLLNRMKGVANPAVLLLALADAVLFVLPAVSDVLFYDTWIVWVGVQLVVNAALAFCLVYEVFLSASRDRWIYIGALLPLMAFAVDVIGTRYGAWQGGRVSQYVFSALFTIAVVMVLKLIPANINAANKAKELEMERIVLNAQIAESRISTMMSQIRPHFIYNTLGSIEQLCKLDPPKAGELVHNFAKYLRGNFGELDNPKPILMSQEMEHVRHYISIENVRFPDMTFTFEMNCTDFHIPALTVQPIVENAIKHGLMKLPKGGTISVVSYETDTDYCISVEDDGVGFDTSALLDDRKHVGLRNIRERLKVMVNGTLAIESTVGVGTKVHITIPKEVRE